VRQRRLRENIKQRVLLRRCSADESSSLQRPERKI
jgi:hypothetical protein